MDIVLIGAGNMGSAMVAGLSRYNLILVDKDKSKVEALVKEFGVKGLTSVPNVDGKVVILAVKPQILEHINLEGRAEALVSILAGVGLDRLKKQIDAEHYVRAMPNVAAINKKAVTSLVGDIKFKDRAVELLSSIGKTVWLNSEKELDIATGLAASSPAWLALVAEALADGAVNLGLPRDKAYEYLGGLFEGVGSVLEDTHPALFKDMVTSPGGTTIAGLYELEDKGVRAAFMSAMEGCYIRAKSM